MSQPALYTATYSFIGFQNNAPSTPLPAPELDNEFANVAASIASIVSAIEDIRRSDGKLNNGVVTFDSFELGLQLLLDPTNGLLVAAAVATTQANATATAADRIAAAASAAAALAQATAAATSAATVNLSLYLAKANNLAGLGSKSTSRANLDLGTAAILDVGTTANKIVQLDGAAKLPALDGSQLTNIDVLPVGTTIWVNAILPPSGFLKENGALVSRATYPRLWTFAATGGNGNIVSEATWAGGSTGSFSTGDLVTTFRLPDSRGEFFRSYDDGRGVDSGRVMGAHQDDANKAHTHAVTGGVNGATSTSTTVAAAGVQLLTGSSAIVISSQGSESRPRNNTKLACIKY